MLIVIACPAQRRHTNWDEGWKFQFGNASDPSKDFNYGLTSIYAKSGKTDRTALAVQFNDSSWRTLNLPHDWAVELPFVNVNNADVESHGYKPVGGLFPETSVGWYRKHFTVASPDSGHRYQLQFDGIFRDARIWVNGFYLGNNLSGYTGVEYDITDFINYNRDNVVTMRVDASQYEGWFYEGAGIYRHVWLNEYNNMHVTTNGIFVYTKTNGTNALVTAETSIVNQGLAGTNCTIQTFISDRTGKSVAQSAEQKISVARNEEKTSIHKINLLNIHPWSLEDPYLYRITTVVRQNGKIIDSIQQRFGVRTIDIRPDGVFLNSRHVKIFGTNNHQDHAGVGSAIPDYLQYYRIKLLKDLGCNAYRTSHNAPTPELLDACDSLGMLVLDENRLLNSSEEYLNQFEKLLKRDRNHPSIFLWSIGNEEGWIQTNNTGKRIAQSLLALQQKLDPTRLSTYAADVANTFHGVNEVIPVRGFNYRQFGVADYHRDHPAQPIIGTEMGSTVTTRGIYAKDSIRAYVPDQDITAPWWASTAETWWKLAAENDFWLGGFVWTGFDYRGEPTPYRWPNINSHFGIMDVCGFPKNIYYYYQSWWTNNDVLHISPHWNQSIAKQGEPVEVWVNTNADNVELFLNGKSQGKKDMPRNSHLTWNVNYQPGRLEAIAYKKEKKLIASVETTGAPFEVVLTPYKTTMYADGKDVTVMNVSVVDRQGREVPDADNLIRFSWSGDARIIGVGNGDPSSHEPDKYTDDSMWQRRLFNGKCQVILQSGKTAGIIHFEARSDSLHTASTGIHTISPLQQVTRQGKITAPKKTIERMIGADISFLPQLEARGMKFSDKGVQKDAIMILKDHGFNYVRLRIFHDPSTDSGYSPKTGFCDLAHTLEMAKRVKAAGMKLLLDFHYSDYWADPEKQYKPKAWRGLPFPVLKDSVYQYTQRVIRALKNQGTKADMVQIGNEVNHGIIWPEGHVGHLDSLAQLINAGTKAAIDADPSVIIMLHIALGGQHDESEFFIQQMLARGVYFDVIGESYYPKWHGTLQDLQSNLTALSKKYGDVIVVEYSAMKKEIHDIVFNLPDGRGKGTCIWEPLNTWEKLFERDGKSNEMMLWYDEFSKRFIKN